MRGLRLVVLGVVIAAVAASAAAAPLRLSVVVIMADDLDVHSLETMVALGQMPAFKANFVDAGVRFTPHDPRYRPPGWDDGQALVDTTTYQVYDYVISDNGTLVRYGHAPEDYQTDVLASRAAAFIARAPGPFFLAVMPLAPHVEIHDIQEGAGARSGNGRSAPRHVMRAP